MIEKMIHNYFTTLQSFVLLAAFVLIPGGFIVRTSLEIEKTQYVLAVSTLKKYNVSAVCANYPSNENGNLVTILDSSQQAQEQGNMSIVHCGACGHCSTNIDIEIMKKTKQTLTKTATSCAIRGLMFGEDATNKCLDEKVGFSPACSSCWTSNIQCTRKKCRFTCLKSLMLREPNNNDGISLNSCLECDEKLCGPEFLKCAGANRRRLGIESDIKRDTKLEQCKVVSQDNK